MKGVGGWGARRLDVRNGGEATTPHQRKTSVSTCGHHGRSHSALCPAQHCQCPRQRTLTKYCGGSGSVTGSVKVTRWSSSASCALSRKYSWCSTFSAGSGGIQQQQGCQNGSWRRDSKQKWQGR